MSCGLICQLTSLVSLSLCAYSACTIFQVSESVETDRKCQQYLRVREGLTFSTQLLILRLSVSFEYLIPVSHIVHIRTMGIAYFSAERIRRLSACERRNFWIANDINDPVSNVKVLVSSVQERETDWEVKKNSTCASLSKCICPFRWSRLPSVNALLCNLLFQSIKSVEAGFALRTHRRLYLKGLSLETGRPLLIFCTFLRASRLPTVWFRPIV